MLELELAPELDVTFAQADSLAETHALLREEDRLDAVLISVGMPDGDRLDLLCELEEDGGGRASPQRLVITAYPEHSVATRAMEAGASGPAFSRRGRKRGRPFSRPPYVGSHSPRRRCPDQPRSCLWSWP